MPGEGYYLRSKPILNVKRGWDPNETTGLHATYAPKTGEAIKSGMVISPKWDGTEGAYLWIKGCEAGLVPHFAVQDQDDHDVLESGVLTGLPCLGKYRLQTGYYKSGASPAYNAQTPLTYDGVTGDVKTTTLASGDPILGYLSEEMRGPLDLTGVNSEASDLTVVVLDTNWTPVNPT